MIISQSNFSDNVYGTNLAQYPFFYDIISQTILNKAMDEFYEQNNHYSKKTCHDCRHTYATWLGGHDITGTLQEYICGHQKESAKRYNHLKEQLLEKSKLKTDDVFSGW
jgi:integrase